MTADEIIALARDISDDTEEPFLWSDNEWVNYLNKVLNELCEETLLISDSTTAAICTLAIAVNTAKYPYDTRIIRIKRAKISGETNPLVKKTIDELDVSLPGWESQTGTPKYYITEQDTGSILLIPKPDAIKTLNFTVNRLPLAQISLSTLGSSPEIHFKYHPYLLDGMLAWAYRKQDADTFEVTKASGYGALWVANINIIKADKAREEYMEKVIVAHSGLV